MVIIVVSFFFTRFSLTMEQNKPHQNNKVCRSESIIHVNEYFNRKYKQEQKVREFARQYGFSEITTNNTIINRKIQCIVGIIDKIKTKKSNDFEELKILIEDLCYDWIRAESKELLMVQSLGLILKTIIEKISSNMVLHITKPRTNSNKIFLPLKNPLLQYQFMITRNHYRQYKSIWASSNNNHQGSDSVNNEESNKNLIITKTILTSLHFVKNMAPLSYQQQEQQKNHIQIKIIFDQNKIFTATVDPDFILALIPKYKSCPCFFLSTLKFNNILTLTLKDTEICPSDNDINKFFNSPRDNFENFYNELLIQFFKNQMNLPFFYVEAMNEIFFFFKNIMKFHDIVAKENIQLIQKSNFILLDKIHDFYQEYTEKNGTNCVKSVIKAYVNKFFNWDVFFFTYYIPLDIFLEKLYLGGPINIWDKPQNKHKEYLTALILETLLNEAPLDFLQPTDIKHDCPKFLTSFKKMLSFFTQ
jgi:hypothetical protein